MKLNLLIKVVALLCGGLVWGSVAAGDLFKPGLWEETTVKDGITNNPKGHTSYKCWSAAKIAELGSRERFWKALSAKLDKSCTLKSYELSGKALSYEVSCKGGSGIAGKIVAESPTSKQVAVTMNFGKGAGTSEDHERWVSADCGEYADEKESADAEEEPAEEPADKPASH